MTPQFRAAVEAYGPRFMVDLRLKTHHVGGMFGNFAVESDEFRALQEYKPVVKGSRGGWGWAQWTGPRRRAFEEWCRSNSHDPSTDEAMYGFVLFELRGSEKAALAALRRATTVEAAAKVFMEKYERPGVPHLERRQAFAREAAALLSSGTAPAAGSPRPTAPAPRVETVQPEPVQVNKWRAFWDRLTGRPVAPLVPVIAGSRGDPTIFYVQKTLREKAYYTKGFLDGLDGGLTQGAVSQARKDNGMGDGGIDTEFLTRLPAFPQRPVSIARATATIGQAAQHAPELFNPPAWLWKAGLGMIGLGGADQAQQAGWLQSVQGGVQQAGDVLGTLQTAFGYVGSAVAFVVEHRTLFLILAGLFLVWKGVSAILTAWIRVRQAFF